MLGFCLIFHCAYYLAYRMIFSEIAVWAIAILINVTALLYFQVYYNTTPLTKLTYAIMTTPNPYWVVILLSGIGTFLSIRFGDELMGVVSHKDRDFFHKHNFKHEIVLFIFFILVIFGYYEITSALNIEIKHNY